MSREAVIVSTARTPLAKSWRGAFNLTHGSTLAGHAVKAAIERAGIDPASIEDVIMGCGLPEGTTGNNIGRQAAIRAGLPVSVAGIVDAALAASAREPKSAADQRSLQRIIEKRRATPRLPA